MDDSVWSRRQVFAISVGLTALGLTILLLILFDWIDESRLSVVAVIVSVGLGLTGTGMYLFRKIWIGRVNIRSLIACYVSFFIVSQLANFPIIGTALDRVVTLLGIVLGVVIAWQFLSRTSKLEDGAHQAIQSRILDAFKSLEFPTVLTESETDSMVSANLGLGHIPHLLKSAKERQGYHIASARRFLTALVATGALAIIVVVGAGYIMVMNDSAGVAKSLRELSENHRALATSIETLSGSLGGSSQYKACCSDSVESLLDSDNDELRAAAYTAHIEPSVTTLQALVEVLGSHSSNSDNKIARDALGSFLQSHQRTYERVAKLAAEGEAIAAHVRQKASETSVQMAETLKRVAIGLVLASFFLALLGAIMRLFARERDMAIVAERDELETRRFYICLRAAQHDTTLLSQVLTEYLRVGSPGTQGGSGGSGSYSPEEQKVQKKVEQLIEQLIQRKG